jgi:hypothetical protein
MAKLLQIDHEGQAKWTWWKRESEKSERRNLEYLNRSLKPNMPNMPNLLTAVS